MKRIHVGFIIGLGLLGLGLVFGFVFLGPCFSQSNGGGEACLFAGTTVDSAESFLLVWGLVILGVGILVVSLLVGRRALPTKGEPVS